MRMVTERSGVSMRPPWIEGFVSFIPLLDRVPVNAGSTTADGLSK
jgi:hypothetical protein